MKTEGAFQPLPMVPGPLIPGNVDLMTACSLIEANPEATMRGILLSVRKARRGRARSAYLSCLPRSATGGGWQASKPSKWGIKKGN